MSHESFSEIANVPNAITGGRLVGVAVEAYNYVRTGEIKHVLGAAACFGLDLLDGPAARRLGQETEFGKDFDPLVDKLSIAAIGAASIARKDADIVPFALVAGVNVSNIAASVLGRRRGFRDDTVTKEGKLSQLGMNVGYGVHMMGKSLERSENQTTSRIGSVLRRVGGAAAIGTAATLGLKATTQYWKQALRS